MTRRTAAVLGMASLSLLLLWSPAAAQCPPDQKPRNVILIGWDGAQREHVKECIERKELPNLMKLAAEGTMVDIDVIGTTDTKAGWSQILTGYNPQVTGVYSNGRYDAIPKGLSIFERLEQLNGADAFVTVATIGKKGHCGEINPPKKIRLDANGNPEKSATPAGKAGKAGGGRGGKGGKKAQAAGASAAMLPPEAGAPTDAVFAAGDEQPKAKGGRRAGGAGKAAGGKGAGQPGFRQPQGKIVEENGVKYRLTPASPYYNMYTALELWDFGLMLDEKVGNRAIEMLDKYKDKPFFFFVHFAEVDHRGHKGGENSDAYNNALISNDTQTGRIVAKLKELGLYDKTLIYVTADHGFDEGGKSHKKAPTVFLATNDKKVCRGGIRADIAPTIYDRWGIDTAKFAPPLDGQSLLRPAK